MTYPKAPRRSPGAGVNLHSISELPRDAVELLEFELLGKTHRRSGRLKFLISGHCNALIFKCNFFAFLLECTMVPGRAILSRNALSSLFASFRSNSVSDVLSLQPASQLRSAGKWRR